MRERAGGESGREREPTTTGLGWIAHHGDAVLVERLSVDARAAHAAEFHLDVAASVREGLHARQGDLRAEGRICALNCSSSLAEHEKRVANLGQGAECGARVEPALGVLGVEAQAEALAGEGGVEDDHLHRAGRAGGFLAFEPATRFASVEKSKADAPPSSEEARGTTTTEAYRARPREARAKLAREGAREERARARRT